MARFSIPTGNDFIFAKLHGLWARAVYGERLRKLTTVFTEELLCQS